ncbi:hypothetical protein SELMODRAFT_75581 [Selaginella moellendorffii]|uniref:Alliinase C-terminal domain-containing protein n=1 Tax=Selaginella moellendorffii TaxID=88036 RepID=D8QPK3_SELML|nr:tryptophan aminotransferase-related protein 4 [Selaginella moellendorffii]EFJ38295.1 hypothetical protein SELMODRAFT_75581 [Selaginella moellendorffii]|eukprot:XP_002960756.1 tryptophan aminotransferase-related protein 4 [Selaginella moellendorffii]
MAAGAPRDEEKPLLHYVSSTSHPWVVSKQALLLSLLLNLLLAFAIAVFFLQSEFFHLGRSAGVLRSSRDYHWTSKASAEAEKAAAIPCSGHGRVFVDTILAANGEPSCECNRCFAGTDCSSKIKNCNATVDSGDPMFLEPFWDANAEAGAVVIPPVHRMSYFTEATGEGRKITLELERLIRQVHEFVGNAVIKDKFIVIGTGSMELINAAVASLAPIASNTLPKSPPAIVVSRAPYYQAYQMQTEFFASTQYIWGGEPSIAAKKFANTGSTFIEFVAAPNNPDASMKEPELKFNGSFTVFDRAYYWPHYSPIFKAMDDDVMLFTLSKLTGHAGSRLGWAIVKDPKVYARLSQYVLLNTNGVSHDTQLRASRLLRAVLEGYSTTGAKTGARDPQVYAKSQHIFHFAQSVMNSRWQKLEKIFARSMQFSLQYVEAQQCNFFKAIISPSPAYAWVKCEDPGLIMNSSCFNVFKNAGIIGRAGGYDDERDNSYVRFALLIGNDDFDNFMEHLNKFLQHFIDRTAIL